MRRLIQAIVMMSCAVCAAVSGSAAEAINLCPNPGMEVGDEAQPRGWTASGQGATWDRQQAHAGGASLRVARPVTEEDPRWTSDPIAVTPGGYRLSGWLRGSRIQSPDISYGVKLYVIHYDAAGKELRRTEGISSQEIMPVQNVVAYNFLRFDWTHIERPVQIGPDTQAVRLQLAIHGVFGPTIGDAAWLDDVRFEAQRSDVATAASQDRPANALRRDIPVHRVEGGKIVEFHQATLGGVFTPDEPVEMVIGSPEPRPQTVLHWAVRDGWNVKLACGELPFAGDTVHLAIPPRIAQPFVHLSVECVLSSQDEPFARRVVTLAVMPDLSSKTAHPFQAMGVGHRLFPLLRHMGVTIVRNHTTAPAYGEALLGDPILHLPKGDPSFTPEAVRDRVQRAMRQGQGRHWTYWQFGNEVSVRTEAERAWYLPRWRAFVDAVRAEAPEAKLSFGSLNVFDGFRPLLDSGAFDDADMLDLHYPTPEFVASVRQALDRKYGVGKKELLLTEVSIFGSAADVNRLTAEVFRQFASFWHAGADQLMWCAFGGIGSPTFEKELADQMESVEHMVKDFTGTPNPPVVAQAILVDRLNGMRPDGVQKLGRQGAAWFFTDGDQRAMVLDGGVGASAASVALVFDETAALDLIDMYGRRVRLAPAKDHVLNVDEHPIVVSWSGPSAKVVADALPQLTWSQARLSLTPGATTHVEISAATPGRVVLRAPQGWDVRPREFVANAGEPVRVAMTLPESSREDLMRAERTAAANKAGALTPQRIRLHADLLDDAGQAVATAWCDGRLTPPLRVQVLARPLESPDGPAVLVRLSNLTDDKVTARLSLTHQATRAERPVQVSAPVTLEPGLTLILPFAVSPDDLDPHRATGYAAVAHIATADGELLAQGRADLCFRGIRRVGEDWPIDGTLSKYDDASLIRLDRRENFLRSFDAQAWGGPEDVSAAFALRYNDKGLIVALDVVDDSHYVASKAVAAKGWIWKCDSFEIGLSTRDASSGSSRSFKFYGGIGPLGLEVWRQDMETGQSIEIAQTIPSVGRLTDAGGYQVEMLIPWNLLGDATHGPMQVLPLGLTINEYDAGPDGQPQKRSFNDGRSVMVWGGMTIEPGMGAAGFLPLVFVP